MLGIFAIAVARAAMTKADHYVANSQEKGIVNLR
jgi:hypothetical protein